MNDERDDTTSPPFELTREGHHRIRIRAGRRPSDGKSQQLWVTIATTDPAIARSRLARLREVSAALTTQGLTFEAKVAIQKAAEQTGDLRFALMCDAALELAPRVHERPRNTWSTFRELGRAWTSGELHRKWPDHVAKKRSSDVDAARLAYLCELVVDDEKNKLGDLELGEVTVDHAMAAMAQLPSECRRPATRRQYAQLIGRVLKLAVFPCAIIAVSPLPRNFLPSVPEGDLVFPHFYPDEDLRLMRCAALSYAERALIGLCNREGGRLGEFLRKLKWSAIDARRGELRLPGGIFRKNGKPGVWQAEPGSIEALEPLRELGGEGPFTHLPDDRKWSDRLAEMMRAAGLERQALYYSNVGEGFRRMRGHDTRATYITLALAAGLSESHIMARTGHTTSKMVHRYDHAAEALSASDGGCKLMPLDVALGLHGIGAGAPRPARRSGWLTLDPLSAEASTLERLALPPAAAPLLGPGDDEPDGGPGGSKSETGEGEGGREVFVGELVDVEQLDDVEALLDEHETRARAVTAASSGPMRPGNGGVTALVSARPPRAARPHATPEGEMLGETSSGYSRSCHAVSGKNGGMFSASVREPGVEPRCLAAPEPKCGKSEQDDTPDELSVRNLVAGRDAKPHGVSPETGQLRRENEALDPVVASLRAAAHAAVDAGDAATVASLMGVIAEHVARRAGAA